VSRATNPTKKITARARLVLASFVVAIVALTTALTFAQEHGGTPAHGDPAPAHGVETGGAQSGEHRSDVEAHGAEHGEHAEHAEHATAGGHHGPEAINWTDIWDKKRPAVLALVINFGVLLTL
jgi:hypothetical protein